MAAAMGQRGLVRVTSEAACGHFVYIKHYRMLADGPRQREVWKQEGLRALAEP